MVEWSVNLILIWNWTDHVRNEVVLLRVKEQRNILHEISKRKANWVGHILRRHCLLQRVIEGKIKGRIEVTGRWGRRRRKLLDDLKERRGYSHLKEEALDRTMWRARLGRGFGHVVRQPAKWRKWMNISLCWGTVLNILNYFFTFDVTLWVKTTAWKLKVFIFNSVSLEINRKLWNNKTGRVHLE